MSEKSGFIRKIRTYLERNKLGDVLVLRGIISAADLKQHLFNQKASGLRLGEYLVTNKIISKNQLAFALATQSGMRSIAAGLAVFASVSFFSAKTVHAGSIKDIPASLTLASASVGAGNLSQYPALFGSTEQASRDISAFSKWSDMFSKFERDVQTGNGGLVMAQWKHDLQPLKNLSLREKATRVNQMVNKTRYITDNRNWGKSDYWATPVEFFTRGGDCEDFAIAKYASLRALGVSESRMRIAIVQDMQKNIPHAVLIVYGDDGVYVLDNQSEAMKYTQMVQHYKPIYSINRTGWWLHKTPTILASAR
ncbi:MAG: hypothetical protein CL565_04860 [Alphaproteobacteria bacterium]|nr:hypothetical protein [Alphaproteobacteria bacterium]|tara:strand:- start:12 stop:938 length:927 start_codon:yes stop_codon:yes gene_type:complete